MTIPYENYLEIKDKYCITYYGVFNEFILQLIYLKPAIEQEFPGVKLYISCKDELFNRLEVSTDVIPFSKFAKHEYSYVRDLSFDNINHPILGIINESKMNLKGLVPHRNNIKTNKCIILSKGVGHVKSLTDDEVQIVIEKVRLAGFDPKINENIDDAGWVIGVECEDLYKSAIKGIKTTLIPTGFGKKLFETLFPNQEIYSIKNI